MEELLKNIRRELRSAWRYRWYALIVAWLIAPIGWTAVLLMPDVHEATARIYVDTDSLIRNVIGEIQRSRQRLEQALVGAGGAPAQASSPSIRMRRTRCATYRSGC